MPRVTRFFIRAGLLWFLLSLGAGVLPAFDLPHLPVLRPLFWHMLTVGWITQIIMGVSVWMFPGRTREEGFRAQRKPWIAFGCLNAGLVLRVAAEPFAGGQSATAAVILGLSGALQLLAAIAYLLEIWPRVQSKEQRRRQRRKKRKKTPGN